MLSLNFVQRPSTGRAVKKTSWQAKKLTSLQSDDLLQIRLLQWLGTHQVYEWESIWLKKKTYCKDMTACHRVLLKLGTTHPTSQINWVWYQSAVWVLIF